MQTQNYETKTPKLNKIAQLRVELNRRVLETLVLTVTPLGNVVSRISV